ncbi:ras-related protein Rab-17 [Tiliqua scincoides]|uniref:ras-related protein Rab-17 n=1 Tax=Tiliqua scincoides TaxID=71010 RepID=UPI0034618401
MARRRVEYKESSALLDVHRLKETYVFKIVLLGSTSVGKSSLAYRYVKKDFQESLPTVGCSFFSQLLRLNHATMKLEIWDTAGQEKYHSVCHLYYRNANAAILVYDITKQESLEKAKVWLSELEKEFLPGEIIIVLVGNKLDLSAAREVTSQEAKEFATTKGLLYMETSAKSDHQVTELFTMVAQELLKREQQKEKSLKTTPWKNSSVNLHETPFHKVKCCQK